MISNEQITLIVPIHAKPEHQGQVRERLIHLAAHTTRESGNICYRIHAVKDHPEQFVIYEQWRNQDALDFHMEQEYLKKFLADAEALLSKEVLGTFCFELL